MPSSSSSCLVSARYSASDTDKGEDGCRNAPILPLFPHIDYLDFGIDYKQLKLYTMVKAYVFVHSNACDSHRYYYGTFSSTEEAEESFQKDYPETTVRDGEQFWEYSLELQEEEL